MVKFDRKEFRSGVVTCKELVPQEEGNLLKVNLHKFYVKDKGKNFTFENEAYMLEKYPHLFTSI